MPGSARRACLVLLPFLLGCRASSPPDDASGSSIPGRRPTGARDPWCSSCTEASETVAQRERINDVGFITSLIDELVEKRSIDPNAVFVAGVSDGAMMAHRLACLRTSRLRAFAAVIGLMPRKARSSVAAMVLRCAHVEAAPG